MRAPFQRIHPSYPRRCRRDRSIAACCHQSQRLRHQRDVFRAACPVAPLPEPWRFAYHHLLVARPRHHQPVIWRNLYQAGRIDHQHLWGVRPVAALVSGHRLPGSDLSRRHHPRQNRQPVVCQPVRPHFLPRHFVRPDLQARHRTPPALGRQNLPETVQPFASQRYRLIPSCLHGVSKFSQAT